MPILQYLGWIAISRFEIIVDAHLENWNEIRNFLSLYTDGLKLEKHEKNDFFLACEEVFSNICYHAYKGFPGKIRIKLDFNNKVATIEIIDTGLAFDPTCFECIRKPMEPIYEQKVGGMGIRIIRRIMDGVKYCRSNDKNHLFLFKKIR